MLDSTGQPTLMAFWEYDHFPYCLGGGIKQFTNTGNVTVVGYDGMVFKPFMIVPYAAGLELQEKIKAVEQTRSADIRAVETKHNKALASLLPVPYLTAW